MQNKQSCPKSTFSLPLFKEHLCQKNLSELTIKNYLSDIRGFVNWYESGHKETLDPSHIQDTSLKQYVVFLQANKDLSYASKERKLISVKVFVRWINESYNRYLSLSPFVIGIQKVNFAKKDLNLLQSLHRPLVFSRRLIIFSALLLVFLGYGVSQAQSNVFQTTPRESLPEDKGERVVFYKNVDDFRREYGLLSQPADFGYNQETGEYFIVQNYKQAQEESRQQEEWNGELGY